MWTTSISGCTKRTKRSMILPVPSVELSAGLALSSRGWPAPLTMTRTLRGAGVPAGRCSARRLIARTHSGITVASRGRYKHAMRTLDTSGSRGFGRLESVTLRPLMWKWLHAVPLSMLPRSSSSPPAFSSSLASSRMAVRNVRRTLRAGPWSPSSALLYEVFGCSNRSAEGSPVKSRPAGYCTVYFDVAVTTFGAMPADSNASRCLRMWLLMGLNELN